MCIVTSVLKRKSVRINLALLLDYISVAVRKSWVYRM